jgi:hypothetical protein
VFLSCSQFQKLFSNSPYRYRNLHAIEFPPDGLIAKLKDRAPCLSSGIERDVLEFRNLFSGSMKKQTLKSNDLFVPTAAIYNSS